MKSRVKSLGNALALVFLAVGIGEVSSLSAESEFSFSGGWRQDHLRSYAATPTDISTDLVKGSHLNIWQIGLQTRLSPSGCGCDPWMDNFFVRGSAYWGWVNDGVYLHKRSPGTDTTVTYDRGDISRGHTWDYTIGAGYLFGCGNGLKIGPSGGYSYDKISFKGENVIGVIDTIDTSTAIDPLAYFDEGATFSSKWRGPWIGVDALWDCDALNVYAAYEYHWSRWKGSYHSSSPDLTDGIHFSDTRNGKNGYGHTVYLGGHYLMCDKWTTGIGLKYQYFHVRGHLQPTAGDLVDAPTVKTAWNSFSILFDLGYAF